MKQYTLRKCGWCGKDTAQVYKLKDSKFLCLECATKHYNCVEEKMLNHIENIKNGLQKKKDKLSKFKEAMCKHNNLINTGYCVGIADNCKTIFRCSDCGKTIYKKEL